MNLAKTVIVSRSIHIDAPLERVFALMCDPLERARLNPDVEPVEVAIEGGGPLGPKSVCRFRLRRGDTLLDYRTRVREFSPPQLLVTEADTAVPFELRIEARAEHDGTRLTQTERFEPTEEMLRDTLPADDSGGAIARLARQLFLMNDFEEALRMRQRQEEALAGRLGQRMQHWLEAIRDRLERDPVA